VTDTRLERYTVAWQLGDGRWRWAYVEETPEKRELELVSHKEFLSREEAERSATTAYPDVHVRPPAGPRAGSGRRKELVVVVVVVAAVALMRARRVPPRSEGHR